MSTNAASSAAAVAWSTAFRSSLIVFGGALAFWSTTSWILGLRYFNGYGINNHGITLLIETCQAPIYVL